MHVPALISTHAAIVLMSKTNNSSKGDSYTNIGNMKEPMHHNRRVRYAGVLVDTARVYFFISDFEDIIGFIAKFGFNLLHLRLTDDQSFMLKFDSYPELAVPSTGEKKQNKAFVVFLLSRLWGIYTSNASRSLIAFPTKRLCQNPPNGQS